MRQYTGLKARVVRLLMTGSGGVKGTFSPGLPARAVVPAGAWSAAM